MDIGAQAIQEYKSPNTWYHDFAVHCENARQCSISIDDTSTLTIDPAPPNTVRRTSEDWPDLFQVDI